jgi:hypothetical protein
MSPKKSLFGNPIPKKPGTMCWKTGTTPALNRRLKMEYDTYVENLQPFPSKRR